MILYLAQKMATYLLAKFVPLLEMIVWETTKRHTMFC